MMMMTTRRRRRMMMMRRVMMDGEDEYVDGELVSIATRFFANQSVNTIH